MLRHFDQTQLVMKNEISKQKLRLLFHNFGTDFSRVQKKRQETKRKSFNRSDFQPRAKTEMLPPYH